MRRWIGTAVALAALAAAPAAHALPIAIAAVHRTVSIDASASSPAGADAATDGDAANAPGPAALARSAAVQVAADPAPPGATVSAAQTTDAGVAALGGSGHADASATAQGAGAFAQGAAESLFRVDFTATADATLRLVGSVAATAAGSGVVVAFVELASLDSTLDPLLLHVEADPGETLPFDLLAELHAGRSYRLTALARSDADALGVETGAAAGAWDARLDAVPEPGTAVLVALGAALLAGRARRVRA